MAKVGTGLWAALAACALATAAIAGTEEEAAAGDEVYVGMSGAMTLPTGGARPRRLGGAEAQVGAYLSDSFAVEVAAGWMENFASLAVQGRLQFSAFGFYDRYFGYSRFDPFFAFGARGWIGSGGQVGPQAGVGSLYHLTDNWALRFDAGATLGLDSEVGVVYSLSAGVQYAF